MASSTNERQWRLALNKRLRAAFCLLQGDARLTATCDDHCRAFRKICEDKRFKEKLSPLNALEIELLSISSTQKQLEGASLFFTAEDVSDLFKFGVQEERRLEVQRWLGLSGPDIRSRNSRFSSAHYCPHPHPHMLANDAAA